MKSWKKKTLIFGIRAVIAALAWWGITRKIRKTRTAINVAVAKPVQMLTHPVETIGAGLNRLSERASTIRPPLQFATAGAAALKMPNRSLERLTGWIGENRSKWTPELQRSVCEVATHLRGAACGTTAPTEDAEPMTGGVTMSKKKSKWTFFRVVLILGIFIAVAIFILDRILPKPYENDDLDDAWKDDGDSGSGDDPMDSAMGATPPPTADVAYDGTEEDEPLEASAEEGAAEKPKKSRKSAAKAKDSESEPEA